MCTEPTDSYESNSSLYLVVSNNVRHSNTRPVTPLGTTNGVSLTSRVAPPKIARSKRPSGVFSDSCCGDTFPTRISPGSTHVPTLITPN